MQKLKQLLFLGAIAAAAATVVKIDLHPHSSRGHPVFPPCLPQAQKLHIQEVYTTLQIYDGSQSFCKGFVTGCHENGLIKTIQTTPNTQNVSVKFEFPLL